MFQLQEIGRLLVESKPREALEALLVWAREHLPEKVTDIELQLSRVNLTIQTFTQGLMPMADYQANLLQINNGVLQLLKECKEAIESDDGSSAQPVNALHEYHAYTCDRVAHNDKFRQVYAQGRRPVQFYYLYGGDMQSHEGFFRRVSYDLEGRLQDYLNPDIAPNCQAIQLEMTFEFSRQLDLYQQNVLRSFFSMLGLSPNEHEPLLEKNLGFTLEKSPRLEGLTAKDFVCVYLHISQYDWDKEITPEAARWFIDTFCQGDLPAETPTILVFFAIEYDEEDEDVRTEVMEAIQQSDRVGVLPELNMVEKRDVGRWLERYKQLAPNSRARKEMLKQITGGESSYYMEEVELELKKIIDQYNNRIVQ